MMKTLLLLSVLFGAAALANEHSDKKSEMMKAWQEYSTPGEEHKMIAKLAGNWKYTSKNWEDPSKAPEETTGTSVIKMIYGGRFLQQEVKGKVMGMPFEGMGMMGYDNAQKKYISLWVDSMGTGIMHGVGSYDEASKTFKDSGKMTCPMGKEKLVDYHTEWKIVDANQNIFTLWGPNPHDGKEMKMMEMVYRRTK